MLKIRQIKYSKGSTSVQVYEIKNRKRVIVCHIGTARDTDETNKLISLAQDFIKKFGSQLFLYQDVNSNSIINIKQTEFLGIYYGFIDLLL